MKLSIIAVTNSSAAVSASNNKLAPQTTS